MKLVIICWICRNNYDGWKEYITLPVEYESKEAFIKDFMKLAISNYKRMDYNYGRGAYFHFLGRRFEASDHYFEFDDRPKHVLETPPATFTLEEWIKEYEIPKRTEGDKNDQSKTS